MPSYKSEKLAYFNAENLKKAFSNNANSSASVGYIFLGRSYPYANDSIPEGIEDSVLDEREVWDNMVAAKKITGENLQYVIPRHPYVANVEYRQYDDRITLEDLLSENVSQNLKPMYIINDEGSVYKCLSNNNGGISNTQPLGHYTLNTNGNLILATDGYIWKYMYTVPENDEFQTNTWIPVPSSTNESGYSTSNVISVDGEVTTVQIANSGSGYIDTVIKVLEFESACSILTVNSSFFSSENLVLGMGVSGQGIVGDVSISSIDIPQSKIFLSSPTISSGGGSANNYNVFTRIVVQGDGEGVGTSDTIRCIPTYNGNAIEKIIVTENGKNYTWSNVVIYGTGSNASARAIIAPKYGHGYNAAKELGAKNLMVSITIGKIDSSEGGLISNYISFRQFGLMRDPHLFGESSPVSYYRANSFVSQTFNVIPGDGPSFIPNEIIFQGTSEKNSFFSANVNSVIGSTVKLTNVRGKISNTALLKSASVPNGRQVNTWYSPTLQPYTGDVLYVENDIPIYRESGQSENIKFIIKY